MRADARQQPCAAADRRHRRRSPEKGAERPLEDIAKRAGVGIGTFYRHFPTRLDLQEAVFRNQVARSASRGPSCRRARSRATRSRAGCGPWPATW